MGLVPSAEGGYIPSALFGGNGMAVHGSGVSTLINAHNFMGELSDPIVPQYMTQMPAVPGTLPFAMPNQPMTFYPPVPAFFAAHQLHSPGLNVHSDALKGSTDLVSYFDGKVYKDEVGRLTGGRAESNLLPFMPNLMPTSTANNEPKNDEEDLVDDVMRNLNVDDMDSPLAPAGAVTTSSSNNAATTSTTFGTITSPTSNAQHSQFGGLMGGPSISEEVIGFNAPGRGYKAPLDTPAAEVSDSDSDFKADDDEVLISQHPETKVSDVKIEDINANAIGDVEGTNVGATRGHVDPLMLLNATTQDQPLPTYIFDMKVCNMAFERAQSAFTDLSNLFHFVSDHLLEKFAYESYDGTHAPSSGGSQHRNIMGKAEHPSHWNPAAVIPPKQFKPSQPLPGSTSTAATGERLYCRVLSMTHPKDTLLSHDGKPAKQRFFSVQTNCATLNEILHRGDVMFLADRNGFHVCHPEEEHCEKFKNYCSELRRSSQKKRHATTQGFPSTPLQFDIVNVRPVDGTSLLSSGVPSGVPTTTAAVSASNGMNISATPFTAPPQPAAPTYPGPMFVPPHGHYSTMPYQTGLPYGFDPAIAQMMQAAPPLSGTSVVVGARAPIPYAMVKSTSIGATTTAPKSTNATATDPSGGRSTAVTSGGFVVTSAPAPVVDTLPKQDTTMSFSVTSSGVSPPISGATQRPHSTVDPDLAQQDPAILTAVRAHTDAMPAQPAGHSLKDAFDPFKPNFYGSQPNSGMMNLSPPPSGPARQPSSKGGYRKHNREIPNSGRNVHDAELKDVCDFIPYDGTFTVAEPAYTESASSPFVLPPTQATTTEDDSAAVAKPKETTSLSVSATPFNPLAAAQSAAAAVAAAAATQSAGKDPALAIIDPSRIYKFRMKVCNMAFIRVGSALDDLKALFQYISKVVLTRYRSANTKPTTAVPDCRVTRMDTNDTPQSNNWPSKQRFFVVETNCFNLNEILHRHDVMFLSDRHGFQSCRADEASMLAFVKYCTAMRTMSQENRHVKMEGLPSMPLQFDLCGPTPPSSGGGGHANSQHYNTGYQNQQQQAMVEGAYAAQQVYMDPSTMQQWGNPYVPYPQYAPQQQLPTEDKLYGNVGGFGAYPFTAPSSNGGRGRGNQTAGYNFNANTKNAQFATADEMSYLPSQSLNPTAAPRSYPSHKK
eukprot:GILI01007078.1.p1 GENE.GILI01007078.1~~GILI01007078.1.p1  ORF type:complete len:1230 (+),score=221.38 GILI01007078.1:194-3691(+)